MPGWWVSLIVAGASVAFNAGALWLSVRHLSETYRGLGGDIRQLSQVIGELSGRVTRLEALDEAERRTAKE